MTLPQPSHRLRIQLWLSEVRRRTLEVSTRRRHSFNLFFPHRELSPRHLVPLLLGLVVIDSLHMLQRLLHPLTMRLMMSRMVGS